MPGHRGLPQGRRRVYSRCLWRLAGQVPLGPAFAKGLTLRMGQTHMHRYLRPLLERVERGDIDPSFIITHRVALDDAPRMYKTLRDKEDSCIKVVMKPALEAAPLSLH